MSLSNAQVQEYRQLKDSGVAVEDTNRILYNAGGMAETSIHITAKALVGLLALRNDYRVDSEVEVSNRHMDDGEIDVLAWGHESRLTYAIEADHSLTQDKKDRKQEKYVDNTAVQDIQFLNLNAMPAHIVEAYGWIGSQLGLPE